MEHILVRLNDTFAPNGTFGVKGSHTLDATGTNTSIGYDAAVCLELYEPWIVEVYNSSTSSPISTRIVDKASFVSNYDVDPRHEDDQQRFKGRRTVGPLVRTSLNSTGKETM